MGANPVQESSGLEPARSVLRAEEISKSYQGRRVVDGVSVSVETGEVVGLLGPNGAGKTTSFYMIVGLITPDSGQVYLEGRSITSLAMYQRARIGISYLPQEPSIFRKLSVEDNLMAILETLSLTSHQRREQMEMLVEQMGLEKVRKNKGY
ncbi:MAG: ATP-binding cassette domain-containing protein, partial [Bryobacteraceae bacterium]